MAKNVNHVSHIKSTSSAITSGNSVFIADGKAGPKLPVASTLIQGEIAVNLAKDVETLSIVNTSGEIVTFSSDKIIKKVIVDNEQVTSAALNDLEERKQNKLTAGDGITINDDVISATASITPVDLPISGGTATDYSENDVPSAGSVLDRFLADEDRMNEIEVVTSAALNDLNTRLGGKQDTLTAGDNITISSDNVISATDTTYTAGKGISISSSNVISNTAITVVDDELLSSSTNPVANSAVTKAISALTVEVRNNELVDAAALNDLNARKLDASALTEVYDEIDEHTGNTNIHVTSNEKQRWNSSISGVNFDGSAVTVSNGVATINVNEYFNGAEYNSNDKKIYFKHNGTILTAYTIDATDFIKDGMVNDVKVDTPTSGSNSGVTCLVVTFNTDAGKSDIEIPLSDMFDSSLYYTKQEIDNKLGSGFTGSNSGVTVTQAINDSEKVVAAALNDLNNRKLDASAYTEPDLSAYATEEWVSDRLGSGFTGDNSGNTVTKVIEENELVVAASLNDINSRKLDASALTEIQEAISNKQDALSAGTNITIEDNVISAADTKYVAGSGITISGANNEVSVKIVELRSGATYADDEIPSAKSVKQTIVDNELVVASALNDLEERKLDASAFTETAAALETLSGSVREKELVVAASLNDLNSRLIEVSGDVEDHASAIDDLFNRINTLDPEVVKVVTGLPSIGSSDISTGKIYLVKNDSSTESGTSGNVYTEYVYVSGQTGGNRWEKIGEWKPEISVDAALSSSSTNPVQNKVVKSAIDNKQDKLTEGSGITIDSANTISVKIDTDSDAWSSGSTGVPATSALAEVLEEIEEVTATALNDLNDRLLEVSGSQLTASSFKTINGQTIVGSGNISIEGSGGGQANVIETVKVNGNALTPDANKAVDITSVPGSIVSQDASHRFVSDTEKSTWNSKQNAITDLDSIRTSAATQSDWNATSGVAMIKNKPTIPTNLNQLTSAHTHTISEVTNLQTTLNEKVSGITINNSGKVTPTNGVANLTIDASTVGALPTGTTLDNVADGTTRKLSNYSLTSHTHGEYATTGTVNTLNNTVTAHTGNSDIHVTAADKSTWNGKQDAITDLASIRTSAATQSDWNATSGVAMIKNKPTIPAAPGTLTTTATTAQATATNEALSGNIALHKVSKTGSYNDLNNKPTIVNNYVTGGRVDTSDGTIILSRSGLGELRITGMDDYVNGVTDDKVSKTGDTMTGALTISAATTNTLNVIGGELTNGTQTALNVGSTSHQTILRVFDDGTPHAQINGTLEVSTSDGFAIKSTVNSSGETGFQTNGKIISSAFQVSGHTNQYLNELLLANGRILVLPTFSGADNGKILGIQNGQLAWITPTTIYTGTGTPSSSQGNNGDIYLQTS